MNKKEIREIENESIKKFMESNSQFLKGRVLDFGAGKMPYKDLVNGVYVPFDKLYSEEFPLDKYDAIMCNQVLQYLLRPDTLLREFANWLKPGGYLVMTYPTCWEEVEGDDIYRFTKNGMELLLAANGFEIIKHERRCYLPFEDFNLSIGYGIVARKR